MTIEETQLGWLAGTRVIMVGLLLLVPVGRGRSARLPILVRVAQAKGRGRPAGRLTAELVRELIGLTGERHPRRRLHAVLKEGQATQALRGLPENVTVTVQMPEHAVIHGPTPPRTGRPGRPRLQGDRLGSLSELVAAGGYSEVATAGGAMAVKRVVGQWYPVFGAQLVQIVLARAPGSTRVFDIALASTDLDASAAELLERHRSGRAKRSGGGPPVGRRAAAL